MAHFVSLSRCGASLSLAAVQEAACSRRSPGRSASRNAGLLKAQGSLVARPRVDAHAAGPPGTVTARSQGRTSAAREKNDRGTRAALNSFAEMGDPEAHVMARPLRAPLRRSFSDHIRDSTARALDVIWKNTRDRRLAGERRREGWRDERY